MRYLGIYLDSNLKWDVHIKYITKKLRYLLYKFKWLSQVLQINQMKILYYSLVEPHLIYGLLAWGSATNNAINNLQNVQKLIIKKVFKLKWNYPTDNLFSETKIFDIRQLFCQIILIWQYKNRRELVNVHHNYNTRYKVNSAVVPTIHKTKSQRCFTYLGPKLYNLIPTEIKSINSENLFKKKIKQWISLQPRLKIHQIVDLKNIYYNINP